jgi:hypothetical protein
MEETNHTGQTPQRVMLSEHEFFELFELVISRMDKSGPPTSSSGTASMGNGKWVVGFTATCKANTYSKFLYAVVDESTQGEVNTGSVDAPAVSDSVDQQSRYLVQSAWMQLKAEFLQWAAFACCKATLIGESLRF